MIKELLLLLLIRLSVSRHSQETRHEEGKRMILVAVAVAVIGRGVLKKRKHTTKFESASE